MKTLSFLLLAEISLSLFLISCEKTKQTPSKDPDYLKDPNYPTVIYKLDNAILNQKRMTFSEKNKYIKSTLNEFGFCDNGDISTQIPPLLENLTQEEATMIVKNFASQNQAETGVINSNDLSFDRIFSRSYVTGNYWYFTSSIQHFDTIEVINSKISFRLKNRELVECTGNWFPGIYIPQNFNIKIDEAKSILVGKVVLQNSMTGKYNITISSADVNSSTSKLTIVPVTNDGRIELRVAWQIWMNSITFKMYVDVMTGEIVRQESTSIS
jgi:hypothetical protein